MQTKKIAVVTTPGIGDGLTLMTLVENLKNAGHDVTLFCSPIIPLKKWFSAVEILSNPPDDAWATALLGFDQFIVDRYAIVDKEVLSDPRCMHLPKKSFNRKLGFVDNLVEIAKNNFHVKVPVRSNGMRPHDTHLIFQKHAKRILLNPLTADPRKDWPAKKFVRLARKLQHEGFQPVFCVSPNAHDEWKRYLNNEFPLPLFETLDKFVAYIFESGVNIANDSGSGHIATSLGIPTLSLFARKNKATLWRPSFCTNVVALASIHFPSPYARGLWKQLLTVGKVHRQFQILQKKVASR